VFPIEHPKELYTILVFSAAIAASFNNILKEKYSIQIGLNKNENQKGFTLIELMIVIAIIGILTAIAIPQFTEYRKKGYNAQATADAKNFYTLCLANATGDADLTYDKDNLPDGYGGATLISGSFTYTAATRAISCDAAFKHPQGTLTYTLDADGNISQS